MTGQSACGTPRSDRETAVRWWAPIVTDRVRPWVTLKFDAAQPEVRLVILMLAGGAAPAARGRGGRAQRLADPREQGRGQAAADGEVMVAAAGATPAGDGPAVAGRGPRFRVLAGGAHVEAVLTPGQVRVLLPADGVATVVGDGPPARRGRGVVQAAGERPPAAGPADEEERGV